MVPAPRTLSYREASCVRALLCTALLRPPGGLPAAPLLALGDSAGPGQGRWGDAGGTAQHVCVRSCLLCSCARTFTALSSFENFSAMLADINKQICAKREKDDDGGLPPLSCKPCCVSNALSAECQPPSPLSPSLNPTGVAWFLTEEQTETFLETCLLTTCLFQGIDPPSSIRISFLPVSPACLPI